MDTHCVSSDQLPTDKLVDTHVCHLTIFSLTNWWTFMVCHLTGSPLTTSWWTLMVCHLTISPLTTSWWTLMVSSDQLPNDKLVDTHGVSSDQLPTDNLMDTHCVSSDQLPTDKLVDTHV